MTGFIDAVRRFFRLHGAGLLETATKDLDRVVAKVRAAEARIYTEIENEWAALQAARDAHRTKEAQAQASIATLSANQERASRVAARIAGLVE